MKKTKLKKFRDAIVHDFPALAQAEFRCRTDGSDSTAIDVDGQLIFKFPRNKAAREALKTEATILAAVRPALSLPVPDLRIHAGPPLFSSHIKLQGTQLEAEDYARLPERARQQLAADLARFYAELHALAPDAMRAAGAKPISAWHLPEDVRAKALPRLPRKLRPFAREIIAAFKTLPPDPYGAVFGFFDGHGWNMAFDRARQRLNGIFDFADAGFGPLHQDFIASNYISPDLTARIVAAYETLSGRALDRRRIDILTGYHHLSEAADFADERDLEKGAVRDFKDWLRQNADFSSEIGKSRAQTGALKKALNGGFA